METLKMGDTIIEYTLERKKIKNCYISVKEGNVFVRVPTKTSEKKVKELIVKKFDWIVQNVKKQKKSAQLPKKYVDGEVFKVLGKDVVLKISYDSLPKEKLKFAFHKFWITLPIEQKNNSNKIVQQLIEDFYENLAEKEIEKAMRKMTMKVGIAPNSYQIKNLKSTWGNCSASGNISINKKVVMYSRDAIEYVCLHEICHLENMNHSKSFWNMIEKYMPNYKKAEEELKN